MYMDVQPLKSALLPDVAHPISAMSQLHVLADTIVQQTVVVFLILYLGPTTHVRMVRAGTSHEEHV